MTFENGGYFGFKVIWLEKDIGDPLFLFQKIFLFGILNYLLNFKKILSCQINVFVNNHIFLISFKAKISAILKVIVAMGTEFELFRCCFTLLLTVVLHNKSTLYLQTGNNFPKIRI